VFNRAAVLAVLAELLKLTPQLDPALALPDNPIPERSLAWNLSSGWCVI